MTCEDLTRKYRSLKKEEIEILKMKSRSEIKKICLRVLTAEQSKWQSKFFPEDKTLWITKTEKRRKKLKELKQAYEKDGILLNDQIFILQVLLEKAKGIESLVHKIIVENKVKLSTVKEIILKTRKVSSYT